MLASYDNDVKRKLVEGLRDAMQQDDTTRIEPNSSVFDESTGTLYTADQQAKRQEALKAIEYFSNRIKKLKKNLKPDNELKISYCEMAIEALKVTNSIVG